MGLSIYAADTFYEGTGGDPISLSIIFIVFAPIIFRSVKKSAIITFVLYYLSIFFVIISVRRAAIICAAIAILLQLVMMNYKKIFVYLAVGIGIIIILYPVYSNSLNRRFEVRLGSFQSRGLEAEARYVEAKIVIDEFLKKSIRQSLVGTELFNSYNYSWQQLGGYGLGTRNFHTFFANYLHGSGLIGLAYAVFIYATIGRRIIKIKKNIRKNKIWAMAASVGIVLIIVWFIQLNSFGIWLLTENSIIFLYLGGTMRQIEQNQDV